jgi:hypothetical protein
MKLIKKQGENTVISVTSDELIIVNNALNEVCNGLYIDEFETRIGFSIEQVNKLLVDLQDALK